MKKIIVVVIVSLFLITTVQGVSINPVKLSLDKKIVEEPIIKASGPMDSPWPMYCHDVRHTGRSPYNTADNLGVEKWRFYCDDYVEGSAVIDNEGNIYIGSWKEFYAIYPNGTMRWKYPINSWIQSSPAIDENGVVYIGISFGYLGLYAFYPNGTLKWKYPTGHMYSSPAIGNDGTIYFGTEDSFYPTKGSIYALYPNGTLRWRYKTGHVVYSSPAIGLDRTLYCGSHDTYLYALYPNNGTLKWKYKTGHWIRVSPCIADDGTIYVVSLDNYLHAVCPNGTLKWKTNVGAGTSPTIAQDGTIYCGYGKLHAINPIDGSVKWTFDPGPDRTIRGGTPCNSVDGTIYFGTSDGGEIIAVNPDGTEKWRKGIGTVESALAIAEDGTIYVGTPHTENVKKGGQVVAVDFGYIHAFGPGDMKKIEITKPEQGRFYFFGRDIGPTLLGNTVIIGDIEVKVNVYSVEELESVNFYVGPGRTWYLDFDLKYTATEPPFEWKLDEQFGKWPLSCLRLRVVASYRGGCEWREDIVFWFLHI